MLIRHKKSKKISDEVVRNSKQIPKKHADEERHHGGSNRPKDLINEIAAELYAVPLKGVTARKQGDDVHFLPQAFGGDHLEIAVHFEGLQDIV